MEHRFLQCLATVILFFGCGCVAVADAYNWRDLAGAGNTVIGVGAGILTGQKLAGKQDESSLIPRFIPTGGPDPKA